jgi:hypothetical protein
MALALEEESSGVWLNFGAVALHKETEKLKPKVVLSLYLYILFHLGEK